MLVKYRLLNSNKQCYLCDNKSDILFSIDDDYVVCNKCLSDKNLVNLLILKFLSKNKNVNKEVIDKITLLYEEFNNFNNDINDLNVKISNLINKVEDLLDKNEELMEELS